MATRVARRLQESAGRLYSVKHLARQWRLKQICGCNKFAVTVELSRIEELNEIEVKIKGTPLDVVGRLTARSITRLNAACSLTAAFRQANDRKNHHA
jgi:hypothetical protein